MKSKTTFIIISIIALLIIDKSAMAQHSKQMVRFAKIQVYPEQLDSYNTALKEQMSTAIKVEPGVLTYYALAEKNTPSHITILEVYADTAAYKAHIQTPHFKKYKATVEHMVKSLELVDLDIIGVAKKHGM
jgi:quinol monooxygenase YgiN